jgi:hypothetical protein
MTVTNDNERVIEEAVAVLPRIAAALEPSARPADGSWVALTVHSEEESDDVIHRACFTWRYDSPLEPLGGYSCLELTRDQEKDAIEVPVCGRSGSRRLAAKSGNSTPGWPRPRMWMGPRAGDRVQSVGLTYVARRDDEPYERVLTEPWWLIIVQLAVENQPPMV